MKATIKNLDGRRKYRLYRSGDREGFGTFAECFGPNGSRGRLIAEGSPAVIESAIADEGGIDPGLDLYVWDRDEMDWVCV